MRILLADPAALPAARYRRFTRRAQLRGMLADHLVRGEPYLALNAAVLGADEAALLRHLTTTFASAFERAGRLLAREVAGLEAIGFPWAAAELLAAEPPRLPLIGRFDFVQDVDDHWWLLEFNPDTPSGVREATAVEAAAHELLPDASGLEREGERLAEALVGAFRRALADLPVGSALGLLTTASELEDLAQMAYTRELLRKPLAELGLDVVLGDVDNLRATRGGLTLCGRPIAALYRYVALEAIFGTTAFAAIFEAASAGRVRLLNGLYGLLLQHKGLLAWLWAHRDDPLFPPEERAAIREHLPPTWWIVDQPPDVGQAALVAKQVFGREGEEVFFGEDLGPEAWQTLRHRRMYVVQQRVRVAEQEAAVPTSRGMERRRGHATVGCYAVDGGGVGYYTRFGEKIITSRAKWLATFVERGG